MISYACSLFLTVTPALAARASFLQQLRRKRDTGGGDWGEDDDEVPLCTFGTQKGFDRAVKIFAEESENTRYVSFKREGYMTDDGFIESMIKCENELPKSCLVKNERSTVTDCAACPCKPDLHHSPYGNYQKRILELLTPQCQSPRNNTDGVPFQVLLIGLGGGSLAQYIQSQCPQGTRLEAVEYDPRMIEAATHFFGLQPQQGLLEVKQGEGGAVVAAHAKEKRTYDVVIVDVFAGGPKVPASCRSAGFVDNIRRILRRSGMVLHNIKVDYQATLPIYKKRFGTNAVNGESLVGNGELPSHLIVAKAP